MVSTGRLPTATAPVMSKVGFNLIIPCMLMSKVATTLTNDASWALAGIPLAALLQIIAGTTCSLYSSSRTPQTDLLPSPPLASSPLHSCSHHLPSYPPTLPALSPSPPVLSPPLPSPPEQHLHLTPQGTFRTRRGPHWACRLHLCARGILFEATSSWLPSK